MESWKLCFSIDTVIVEEYLYAQLVKMTGMK